MGAHSPAIALNIGDLRKPVPGARVFSNQQPSWDNVGVSSESLEQTAPPEAIVIAPESVILEHNRERNGVAESLAEKSVVGGHAVCTKEEDC